MKLTRKEIIVYFIIAICIFGIPFLFDTARGFNLFYQSVSLNRFYHNARVPIYFIDLLGVNIWTVYMISKSERRQGNFVNNIWQLLGLIFGLPGFLAYIIWNIMIEKDLFMQEEKAVPTDSVEDQANL